MEHERYRNVSEAWTIVGRYDDLPIGRGFDVSVGLKYTCAGMAPAEPSSFQVSVMLCI
jgi:hypothetical protein